MKLTAKLIVQSIPLRSGGGSGGVPSGSCSCCDKPARRSAALTPGECPPPPQWQLYSPTCSQVLPDPGRGDSKIRAVSGVRLPLLGVTEGLHGSHLDAGMRNPREKSWAAQRGSGGTGFEGLQEMHTICVNICQLTHVVSFPWQNRICIYANMCFKNKYLL